MKLFEFITREPQHAIFIVAEDYDAAIKLFQAGIDDDSINAKSIHDIVEWFELDIDKSDVIEILEL